MIVECGILLSGKNVWRKEYSQKIYGPKRNNIMVQFGISNNQKHTRNFGVKTEKMAAIGY
jgi:hypothetical protein